MTESLRQRKMLPDTIEQMAKVIAAAYPEDEFVGPLARKLLGRHAIRPGRKKSKGPTQHQLKIVQAVAWARFNGGSYDAVVRAAQDSGLRESVVWRAFEGKDTKINAILRERNLVREKLKRGE